MYSTMKWMVATALVGIGGTAAAQVTYNVDFTTSFDNELIQGTITTDGQTANPLTASDITSWSLYATSGPAPFSFGGGPGSVTVFAPPGASPLTASATSLTYNFTEDASILFQSTGGNAVGFQEITTAAGDDSFVLVNTGGVSTQLNMLAAPTVIATVAAPEMDPASAAGGLTLLLGTLAVLRGRRAKPRDF
jgi:hypothetical protein